MEMEVEDGKIINVRPDKDNPINKGYCCRKGRTAKYYQDNADRLDYPLKKVGDHFERISWEQAISEIAERSLAIKKQYGGKSFAMVGGGNAAAQGEGPFAKAFLSGLGSCYWYNPIGVEFMGVYWSHGKIYGDQLHYTEPDDENSEVLIYWGSNSYVAHNYVNGRRVIREASQNPDKLLIVVDPRLSETARMADMHIQPRNGSDGLLLRGLIALIIERGWQNQAWLNEHAEDYARILPWFFGFDYRKAFEVCGVSYKQAEAFARILTTRRWGMHQDLGIYFNRNNTLTSYLCLILQAVCGVASEKGGAVLIPHVIAKSTTSDENDPKTVRTVETNSFPVLGFYPEVVLSNEIMSDKPERTRAIFCTLSNPLRSYPDTNKLTEAFKKLDLLVVVDVVMTETAEMADYVLPARSGYEGYDFQTFVFTYPDIYFSVKRPVVPSKAERRDGAKIWLDLLMATGGMKKPPKWLYDAAEKAVKSGDRMSFFFKALAYMISQNMNMDIFPAMLGEVMGEAMGSPVLALAWAGMLISPLAGTGQVEKAGIKPLGFHPVLEKMPKMKDFFVMDAAFQRVYEHPEGAIIGIADTETQLKNYVKYPGHKLHLWCEEIDRAIQELTPEKEEAALKLPKEYPFLLSSGRHSDGGVNNMMRNHPKMNAYRDYYKLSMNPADAAAQNLADGETVRVVTKAGEITIPIEVSKQISEGYCMIPHYFGHTYNGKTYGMAANLLVSRDEHDPITGNAYFRYLPCRIEKLGGDAQ